MRYFIKVVFYIKVYVFSMKNDNFKFIFRRKTGFKFFFGSVLLFNHHFLASLSFEIENKWFRCYVEYLQHIIIPQQ